MKQVLIFSDSICVGLEKLNFEYSDDESSIAEKNTVFSEECYPGATAEGCVCAIKNNLPYMNLKKLLKEANYDGVVICFGTNDIGTGRNAREVVKDLEILQNLCVNANVKTIVLMMLRDKTANQKLNEILVNETFSSIELCDFLLGAEDNVFEPDGIHLTEDGKKLLYDELIRFFW